jgi:hypothetical protein
MIRLRRRGDHAIGATLVVAGAFLVRLASLRRR